MLLRQIASGDARTRLVLGEMERVSPLLRNYVHFYTGPGAADTVRAAGSHDTLKTRSLGEGYSEDEMAPATNSVGRKLAGDAVKMDKAYEVMGYDVASEFELLLVQKGEALGLGFNNLLINGDPSTDAEQFAGLKKTVTTISGVSGYSGQVITGFDDTPVDGSGDPDYANYHKLVLGNSDAATNAKQRFLRQLDRAIAQVRGTYKAIVMNGNMMSTLTALAREYVTETKDQFGIPIKMYNGIPLIDIGFKSDGSDIITSTESLTLDSTEYEDSTSIYIVGFGEKKDYTFWSAPEGFKVYPMVLVDNWYKHFIDLIADSTRTHNKCIARLKGIRII